MLRAFAWLVSNVVSLLGTVINRNTRDWHTDATEDVQLPTSNDFHQEINPAESTGASLQALMVSSTRSVCPSNHEGVLTAGSEFKEHAFPAKAGIQSERSKQGTVLSPLVPTNVGIQGKSRALFQLPASSLYTHQKPFPNSDPHPELVDGRRNVRFKLREISLM
ncbi:MAG: hypothetical protein ABMA14_05635 [Hyphomonadaceae bacterium]